MRHLGLWLFPLFLLVIVGLSLLAGRFGSDDGVVFVDIPVVNPHFDAFTAPNLLVFFGYAGCEDVCTPRLFELADIYRGFGEQQQRDTDVVFVNITSLSDPELPGLFAASFHPDFRAITPEKEALHRLMRTFTARYAPSLRQNGTIDHTAFLYLLKRQTTGYAINGILVQTPFRAESIQNYFKRQR